jgi:hypothetical protein
MREAEVVFATAVELHVHEGKFPLVAASTVAAGTAV